MTSRDLMSFFFQNALLVNLMHSVRCFFIVECIEQPLVMSQRARALLYILSLMACLQAFRQRDRPGGGGIPIGFSNELDVVAGPVAFYGDYGQWVGPSATSFTADQLRAMKGSSTVFDVGVQLEYYIWSIRDFMAQDQSWAPYFAAGLHWVGFDPYAYSDFGNLNTPITTPNKYY